MGICGSSKTNTPSKTECQYCSKASPQHTQKQSRKCLKGHKVCQMCIIKAQGESSCPHCQARVPQIKQIQQSILPNVLLENPKKPESIEVEKQTTVQQYNQLNQEQTHQQPELQQEVVDEQPAKKSAHPQPIQQTLVQQEKKPEALQPAKPAQNEQKPLQKKVCGCSIQNFLVVIVLIVQTLFTVWTMYNSFNQPKSECMDVPHLHPNLAMRPLMQQVSGVETVITTIMSVSAFIYKRGCLSESFFDKWLIFLKFILSMKQLLWTALQTFMQVVIMPLYCDPDIMRFTLITSVANLVSFLLVIIKPVYTCISQKCCCKKSG